MMAQSRTFLYLRECHLNHLNFFNCRACPGIGRPLPTENKIADPLNIERSTVTKLVITSAPKPYPDRPCHIDYTAHPHRCGCLSEDDEARRRFDQRCTLQAL